MTSQAQTQATALMDVQAIPAVGETIYVGFPQSVVTFQFVSGEAPPSSYLISIDPVPGHSTLTVIELLNRIVLSIGTHSEEIGAAAFIRQIDYKLLFIANEVGEEGNNIKLGTSSPSIVVEPFSGGSD